MNETTNIDDIVLNHIMAGEVRFKENDQPNERAEIQYSWDFKFGEPGCGTPFGFSEK